MIYLKKLNMKIYRMLAKNCSVEGGDIILHDEYIFIGTCEKNKFDDYKTARTNQGGINFIKKYFPEKKYFHFR